MWVKQGQPAQSCTFFKFSHLNYWIKKLTTKTLYARLAYKRVYCPSPTKKTIKIHRTVENNRIITGSGQIILEKNLEYGSNSTVSRLHANMCNRFYPATCINFYHVAKKFLEKLGRFFRADFLNKKLPWRETKSCSRFESLVHSSDSAFPAHVPNRERHTFPVS